MTTAVPIKYNFYHSAGDGRDGFIRYVSEHQTNFNYVPKAPECTPPPQFEKQPFLRDHLRSPRRARARAHSR